MNDDLKVRPASREGEVALLLPGMTLNASIFPTLPVDTLGVDFASLDEVISERMAGYVQRLRHTLSENGFWDYERRYVVAHSFGGMLALAWLMRHGDDRARVDGMVLIGTTAGPMLDRARLRLIGIGARAIRVPVRPILALWDLPLVTKAMKRFTTRGLDPCPVDFQQLRSKSDFAVDLGGWRNSHWQAIRSFRHAMRGFDVLGSLAEVDVPTIVLHGPRDSFFALEVASELASGLPNAELRVIEGAAHLLPLTHGDAVVSALGDLRDRTEG